MMDSLDSFDWSSLHQKYDNQCLGFDSHSKNLYFFTSNRPATDRELYYKLLEEFSNKPLPLIANPIAIYEALLYWKLYSQPAARSNISRWLRDDLALRETYQKSLIKLFEKLPLSLNRDVNDALDIVKLIGECRIAGMITANTFPVRTTFLHFLYPSIMPIFDKMVLKEVGMWSPNANHRVSVLRDYLPCAWELADRYKSVTSTFPRESEIRCIDMALWVNRGNTQHGVTIERCRSECK